MDWGRHLMDKDIDHGGHGGHGGHWLWCRNICNRLEISLSTSPYPTSPPPLLLFCLSHLFCVIFSVEAVVHREKVQPLPPARRQALWTWAPTWNSDYLDLQSRPGTRRDARRSSRCFLKSFFHRISPKMRNIFWQLNLRNSIHNHYPLYPLSIISQPSQLVVHVNYPSLMLKSSTFPWNLTMIEKMTIWTS